MKFDGIKDKRILITGSSTGIGASIAKLFADYGVKIGIHYNSSGLEAKRLSCLLKSKRSLVELFQGNLLDSANYLGLINNFVKKFGGIDILINNAGAIYGYGDFMKLEEKSWDDTFSLCVKAPFFISREAMRFMKKEKGGKIINISSISPKYGGSAQTVHYSIAKAALEASTISLAKIGAKDNILVNTVRCGVIDTAFHRKLGRRSMKGRVSLIPLKRMGSPEEVANMVVFLASSAGNYITGETFVVAGGE